MIAGAGCMGLTPHRFAAQNGPSSAPSGHLPPGEGNPAGDGGRRTGVRTRGTDCHVPPHGGPRNHHVQAHHDERNKYVFLALRASVRFADAPHPSLRGTCLAAARSGAALRRHRRLIHYRAPASQPQGKARLRVAALYRFSFPRPSSPVPAARAGFPWGKLADAVPRKAAD